MAYEDIASSYMASNYAGAVASRESAGMLGKAKSENEIAEAGRADAERRANAKATGAGFRRTVSSDGGWNFWDDEGNPITAWEFARAKGVSLDAVLDDSGNPNDYKVIQDYKDFKNFAAAAFQGDEMALEEYYAVKPQLRGQTPQQLWGSLTQAYPGVFGHTQPSAEAQQAVQQQQTQTVQQPQRNYLAELRQQQQPARQGIQDMMGYIGGIGKGIFQGQQYRYDNKTGQGYWSK